MQSEAQKAMWARIRAAGGLRKVMQQRRRALRLTQSKNWTPRASDYETLFHATHKKNLESILKNGLIPNFRGQSWTPIPLYLGKRKTAAYYGNIMKRDTAIWGRGGPSVVLKIKMPKYDIGEVQHYSEAGRKLDQYRVRQVIKPKYIRSWRDV